MDALTKAAIESLKTLLPAISSFVDNIEDIKDSQKAEYTINEGIELLGIIKKWVVANQMSDDEKEAQEMEKMMAEDSADEEISDEDAKKMLAEMDRQWKATYKTDPPEKSILTPKRHPR